MSACPDCCVDELRRVVDEKKREVAKKKLERATKNKGSLDRSHRSEGGGDGDGHTGARSVRSAPAGAADSDGTAPGSWRPSPQSASLPPQPAPAAHARRGPSQESFRP